MKKLMAMFVCFLFLLSVFAIAEETTTNNDISDSIEAEATEFEEQDTGDAIITETESSLQTDEVIEQELQITEEEKAEMDEASKTIGIRQYILNRQLKVRTAVAARHGEIIIAYLENKSIDASELQGIVDELNSISEGIVPKTMTKEEFNSTVIKVKGLVQKFKETAQSVVPEGEMQAIKNRIKNFQEKQDKKIQLILQKEIKARELYNRKQLRDSLKKVVEDAKELRKDGKKLLDVAARLKNLNQLKNRYKEGNLNITQAKAMWKNETRQYGLDKAASVVKNERAQLAIGSANIRNAIKEAEAAGEDTTQLENNLAEINAQIKEFVPGKIASADAKAKAAVIKSKISNIGENEKLKERLRNAAQVKAAIKEKAAENRKEAAQIKTAAKEELNNKVRARQAVVVSTSNNAGTGDTE